ncbi:hypothetical protein [Catellatospora paridis]|uniref:hypothetical protein n=1 Tax=Catellatospora paridis TaxID=1617086 RepID=UPI0012D49722|nr:hypothetical protein [Catellatospora paridis]
MTTSPTPTTVDLTPAERTAMRHIARLQTTLLAARARRVAIAAVRAGWWQHHSADVALTANGLPGLPMIWPIHLHLPLRRTLLAADAQTAIADARRDITATIGRVFDHDQPLLHLTITSASPDTTGPAETNGHHYLIDATAVLAMPTIATSDRDAYAQARALAAERLAGQDDLALRGAPACYLPADHSVHDLGAPVLDPDVDGPDSTGLQCALAGDSLQDTPEPDAVAAATSVLERLRRSLRRHIIDAIGDGIGNQRGDDGHHYADQILTAMGLDPLPRSWQYHVTATITHTITADSPQHARTASFRQLRDISPTTPQRALPLTYPDDLDPGPRIDQVGPGRYRVTLEMTYLVCLRGANCPVLAEAAVREQLTTFEPAHAALPLRLTALGRRVDRILDRAID